MKRVDMLSDMSKEHASYVFILLSADLFNLILQAAPKLARP